MANSNSTSTNGVMSSLAVSLLMARSSAIFVLSTNLSSSTILMTSYVSLTKL